VLLCFRKCRAKNGVWKCRPSRSTRWISVFRLSRRTWGNSTWKRLRQGGRGSSRGAARAPYDQRWCSSARGTRACVVGGVGGADRFASRSPPRRQSRVNGTRPRGAGFFPARDYSTGPPWEQGRRLPRVSSQSVGFSLGLAYRQRLGLFGKSFPGASTNRARRDVVSSRDGDTPCPASLCRRCRCSRLHFNMWLGVMLAREIFLANARGLCYTARRRIEAYG